MLHKLGKGHVPAFDDNINIRANSTSNVCFAMPTNVR